MKVEGRMERNVVLAVVLVLAGVEVGWRSVRLLLLWSCLLQ